MSNVTSPALMDRAAELIARGVSEKDVFAHLQVRPATFEGWLKSPGFATLVGSYKTLFAADDLSAGAVAEAHAAFGTGPAAPIITRDEETNQ